VILDVLSDMAESNNLEVRTVDSFQGREKEVIIFSMVRSNDEGNFGFLVEDRRTNVAVTRARRHVTVICDSETISKHPFLERYVTYCQKNADYRYPTEYDEEDCVDEPLPLKERILEFVPVTYEELEKKPSTPSPDKKKKKKKQRKKKKKPKPKTKPEVKADGSPVKVERQNLHAKEDQDSYRESVTKTLEDFIKSKEAVHAFPSSLTSYQRMIVHEVAETLKLSHKSMGEKNDRFIEVRNTSVPLPSKKKSPPKSILPKKKINKRDPTKMAALLSKADKEEETSADRSFSSKKSESPKPASDSSKEAAQDDGKLSIQDFIKIMQERHQKPKVDIPPPDKKKANEKSKNPKKKVTANSTEEDLDEVLTEFQLLGKQKMVCAYEGCKKFTHMFGTDCKYCKMRFCVTHGNPIFHDERGCGELYRKDIQKAKRAPPKPKKLKEKDRKRLQAKYKANLEEKTGDRTKKKKPGSDSRKPGGRRRKPPRRRR